MGIAVAVVVADADGGVGVGIGVGVGVGRLQGWFWCLRRCVGAGSGGSEGREAGGEVFGWFVSCLHLYLVDLVDAKVFLARVL